MKKEIINEINEMRKMMGLQEQGIGQAIKKGFQQGKEAVKGVVNKVAEKIGTMVDDKGKEVKDYSEKYNGKSVDEIIEEIYDLGKNSGKIDVNGETLYFGVGKSKMISIAQSKSDLNARAFMSKDTGKTVQQGVAPAIERLMMSSDGSYVSYVLLKQF